MFVSYVSVLLYGILPLKITVPLVNVDSLWSVIWLIICLVYTTVVVGVSNPMFGVLVLILVFLNAAFFIATLKFYFLSFLIIFIYVGAISVLFIFTLMIIPVKSFLKYKHFFEQFRLVYYFIFFYCLINTFLFFSSKNFITVDLLYLSDAYNWRNYIFHQLYFVYNDILALGLIIYTYYFFHFSLISLILLSGMVTAIVIVIEKFFIPKKQKDSIFEYEILKDVAYILDYMHKFDSIIDLAFKEFKMWFAPSFKILNSKIKIFSCWILRLFDSKDLFIRIQNGLELLEGNIGRKWVYFVTLLILFFTKLKKIVCYIYGIVEKLCKKIINYAKKKYEMFINVLLYMRSKIIIVAKFSWVWIVYFYGVYVEICAICDEYYEQAWDWIKKKLGLPTRAEEQKMEEEKKKKMEEESKKKLNEIKDKKLDKK